MGLRIQAFDEEGDRRVDIEQELGVDTEDVESITVTAQKMTGDEGTLRAAILMDSDVVAESSTDEPNGQVTHRVED